MDGLLQDYFESIWYNSQKLGIMELYCFLRFAIEKMFQEKKSLNHFKDKRILRLENKIQENFGSMYFPLQKNI